jgi:hypothetical protein
MFKRFWKKPITWGTIIIGSLIAGLIEYVIAAATGVMPTPKRDWRICGRESKGQGRKKLNKD